MNSEQMLPLLTDWSERLKQLEQEMNNLEAVVGASDGPLFTAVWNAWDGYTKTLSKLIGDDHGALSLYQYKKPRKIQTLIGLAELIEQSRIA